MQIIKNDMMDNYLQLVDGGGDPQFRTESMQPRNGRAR